MLVHVESRIPLQSVLGGIQLFQFPLILIIQVTEIESAVFKFCRISGGSVLPDYLEVATAVVVPC